MGRCSLAHIPEPESLEALKDLRPLGQIHESFIIAAGRDGLWIIDQHVAHERILFEQVLAQRAKGSVESQRMLLPMVITVSAAQQLEYARIAEELDALGFETEPFGNRTIAIKAAPAGVSGADIEKVIFEILEISERELRNASLDESRAAMAATIACRAAIKINMKLDPAKMDWLLKSLAQTSCPMSCPHGGPSPCAIPRATFLKVFIGSKCVPFLFLLATSIAFSQTNPITQTERLKWATVSTIGPANLAGGAFASAFSTGTNSPKEYGPHWDGFFKRQGLRLTGSATSNLMEAEVGALWGEDPRYRRFSNGRIRDCPAWHAIKSSVLAYDRNGDHMPAYARYAAISSSNVISNAWRPDSQRTVGDTTARIGFGVHGPHHRELVHGIYAGPDEEVSGSDLQKVIR